MAQRSAATAASDEVRAPTLHQTVVDNLYDGVYYVDLHRRITYWNQGAERITGYGATAAVGRRCMDNLLMHVDGEGHQLCRGVCPLAETLADGRLREKGLYLQHRDGHRVPVNVRVAPIHDPMGRVVGAVEIFSDDTKSEITRQRLEELRTLAMADQLTGIPNRRYLEMTLGSRVDDLIRYAFPFGLLFIDIDHFKAVNDTLGHDAGDAVLRAVAQTLRGALRGGDVVGRWGGEEFVILVLNVDAARLAEVAERCRVLVAKARVTVGRHRPRVTISIGGVLARAGVGAEALLHEADQAMYASKIGGRDRVTIA